MMTLKQLFDHCIDLGLDRGPRSRKEFEQQMKDFKKEYEGLKGDDKKYYDTEKLTNPFLDTRILYGKPETKLKRVLVGIDIGVEELLLANELGRSGKKIDAVIAHHPEGRALSDLDKVMDVQEDIATDSGVPVNVAEKVMGPRVSYLNRALRTGNNYKVIDAAKLLDIPFMCLHTVGDNQCFWYLKKYIDAKKPKVVGDIMKALMEIPEFQQAEFMGMGPHIAVGSSKSKTGKISYCGITGGTNGPKELYEEMAKAGVGTLIDMHIPEDHRKEVEKLNMNVVVATHMPADSLGVNLLLDELEKQGTEIVCCGGMIRHSRKGKKLF